MSRINPNSTTAIKALLPCRKVVVVIGIDNYAYLQKLQCAVNDALAVQDLLVTQFGFEAPIRPLTNEAATKRAIEALIEDWLRKILGPDDALVLFFAGHGTTRMANLHGTSVETGYIAPVEASGPDHFSDLIDMNELLRKTGMLPGRHILVVLDACHSGIALGAAMSQYRSTDAYIPRLVRNRSRRVITSARRDELALDNGPSAGHSLFTGTLIQALSSGEADTDGNGIITFSELALFLQQRVAHASGSRQTPDYGAFHLDDRGESVFAVVGRQAVSPARYYAPNQPASVSYRLPQRDDRRGRRMVFGMIAALLAVLLTIAVIVLVVSAFKENDVANVRAFPTASAAVSLPEQGPTTLVATPEQVQTGSVEDVLPETRETGVAGLPREPSGTSTVPRSQPGPSGQTAIPASQQAPTGQTAALVSPQTSSSPVQPTADTSADVVTPCGGEGQRACCVWERVPSCGEGLEEKKGCTGDCKCKPIAFGIVGSAGMCRKKVQTP